LHETSRNLPSPAPLGEFYSPMKLNSMKLSLERLSADWQAQHGHPILALESFVDGQLFRGTIYKASNWTMLGPTAGFGRVAEDFYVSHQRPKQLWVRARHPQARPWLSAAELPAVRQTIGPLLSLEQMEGLVQTGRGVNPELLCHSNLNSKNFRGK
jgi:hypothetical protein